MNLIKRCWRDESGVTAIEYGLIAAAISIGIIALVQGFGTKLKETFSTKPPATEQSIDKK